MDVPRITESWHWTKDEDGLTYMQRTSCGQWTTIAHANKVIAEVTQRLAAAEAELDCYRSTNRTMAAELSQRHDKLATTGALLREAVRLVDEARLYELSTDWYERAKAAAGGCDGL